mgnify:CR=1 FL=1
MTQILKQGDREEVVYFVEEFFRDLSNKALQSNIFRQYITMDAYFCVADFLESLSTDTQDPETPSQDEKTQQDLKNYEQLQYELLFWTKRWKQETEQPAAAMTMWWSR